MIKITLTNTDRGTGEVTENQIAFRDFCDRFEDYLVNQRANVSGVALTAGLLLEFLNSYNDPDHD